MKSLLRLRRLTATILAFCLIAGTLPPQASAQAIRFAAGKTVGAPVRIAQNGAAFAIPSVPGEAIGLADINGSLAPVPGVSVHGAPSVAPSIMPALADQPKADQAAAAPISAVSANPSTIPQDAAPIERRTLSQHMARLLGRTTPPATAQEALRVNFDGSANKPALSEDQSVPAVKPAWARLGNDLKAKASAKLSAAARRRAKATDDFGGPKIDPASTNAVRYGLKWGFNMVGISALLTVLIKPLLDIFSWPQHLSEKALHEFGRVVLLTSMGPADILQRIAESPLKFFGLGLPSAIVVEEISFRLLGFGATALALAGLKPATRWLSRLLSGLPDAAGAAGISQSVLKVGEGLSRNAFPIAAAVSSVNFAIAHFSKWGAGPYVLLSNLVLGLVLARTAYAGRALAAPIWAQGLLLGCLAYTAYTVLGGFGAAAAAAGGITLTLPLLSYSLIIGLVAVQLFTTRGLLGLGGIAKLTAGVGAVGRGIIAPFTAHFVFNAITLGAVLIGKVLSSDATHIYTMVTGLFGVSVLSYNYLSARKDGALKFRPALRALVALLALSVGLALWTNNPRNTILAAGAPRADSTSVLQPRDSTFDNSNAQMPAYGSSAIESREDMVARVKPAVVKVIVLKGDRVSSTGSGFILTPEGLFITNAHVVGDKKPGSFVRASVPDMPRNFSAKILAVNHDKDLAILKLESRPDGQPWTTVTLAPTAPREGEEVTALGYPRGLPFSVTHGIISGMSGRGDMYVYQMQTDAAINPGNSGGPLLNARGEVVGVNTSIYTKSGGSDGLGFSIMASEVAHAMEQYARTKNIATAALGIIVDLSDPAAPESGLAVEYVRPGSAAEKAGLQRGDLIVAINGDKIIEGGQRAARHIAFVLSKGIPGEQALITVLRGDEPLQLQLTLDAKVTEAPRR